MNDEPAPYQAGPPVPAATGGALWPVTFIAPQVVTNVYFARSGFWRILIRG